jgi:heptosyltransferase-1
MPACLRGWPNAWPLASSLKILLLKPSSLGDVVQAMPVLRILKRRLPDAEVFWWIESNLAPLFDEDEDLSGVFLFDRRGWNRPGWWRTVWTTVQRVRNERFDLVIDLQGLGRSAFFAWLANAKTTIGLDNAREGNREGAQIFYDVLAPRSPPATGAPKRYLSVLELLGIPITWDFEWLPPRKRAAASVREKIGERAGRWVMLLPGARWDNKRWPIELFAETVKRLAAQDRSLNFAILGAAGDHALGEIIRRSCAERCVDLTGQTSLAEMIEWLRRADLVIANDTGPLHVAAAMERPVLAIYGPSDPLQTGPHNQSGGVLQASQLECVPCMKQVCLYRDPLACLRLITPEQVSSRASEILGQFRRV